MEDGKWKMEKGEGTEGAEGNQGWRRQERGEFPPGFDKNGLITAF
jgi:hypothetical protein